MTTSHSRASDLASFPRRIVCLTDETTETLYLLGQQDRIAGISAYACRPPEARSKPRVSAFKDANFEKILALKPDLVLTFSDVQAEITKQLVLRGVNVFNFNQRSIAEILETVYTLSRIVGEPQKGLALVDQLKGGLDEITASAKAFPHRPKVYFEEWNDPLISGITWVEELIEIAGADPIFPELRHRSKAQGRVIQPRDVVARDPDVILASWCGKKVRTESICSRTGWETIAAVRNGHVYEIPSTCILQPGPAALTEGVRQIHSLLAHVVGAEPASNLRPSQSVPHSLR